MKRLVVIMWCVAMACGPSDGGPSEARRLTGRHSARLVMPADTVVPTEVGADGLVAGSSTGASGVTQDGAASYTLPLWLPAGRAGLHPELALQYKSDEGDGPLGIGWGLEGLSRISRCGRTQAGDGRVEPVTFTADDAFCLDGQRLVAVQGVNGASGTEYRTEVESFSRIVALDADASGPQRFRVFLKNGRVLTYGQFHGSTLMGERISVRPLYDSDFATTRDGKENRLAWALARVEDRSGNSISYHYTLHQDALDTSYEHTLDRIEYTASSVGSGMPATRFVDFEYEARTDTRVSYVAGFKLKSGRRLREIRVRAPNPVVVGLVRAYRLGYVKAPLNPTSLLGSFQECDGAGTCMRPITFGWTQGSAQFEEVNTGLADVTQGNTSSFWILNPVDLDGDGRDELFYRKPYDSTRYKWTFRSLSPLGGMTGDDAVNLPLLCGDARPGYDGRWSDVNLDGRIDVSLLERTDCGATAPSVLKHFRRTNHPAPDYNWFILAEDEGPSGGDFWFADVNADAKPDMVRVAEVDGRPQLGYRLNVGGSLQAFQPIHTSDRNDNNHLVAGLDHTGRTSLLITEKRNAPGLPGIYEPVGQRYWSLTWRNGAFEKQETTLVRTDVSQQQYLFADINGDGLADALRAGRDGGDLEVLVNTGNGFAAPVTEKLPAGAKLGAFTQDNGVRVLDFNGDGLQDLLLMDDAGGTRSNPMVLESSWGGFLLRPLPMPLGQKAGARGYKLSQVLDANGDGQMDFAQVVDGTLRLYLRKGQPSGLLARVEDSLGARSEFTYAPMSDASVYTPGTQCTYPQVCVRKGRWLVAEHRTDAGEHPMRMRRFTYEDGRMDVHGRGWLGFGAVTVRELAASAEQRTEFDHQTRVGTHYPYAKQPRREVTRATGGRRVHLSSRSTLYAASLRSLPGGGSILTVLPDRATEEVYDRLEAAPPTEGLLRRVETDWEHDATYGNLTSLRQIVGTDVLAWTGEYQNDEAAWLIGLLLREQEASTVTGVSVTRTRAYAWQPGTALLARETVEPGDAALELVTSYQRDADGLASRMTRTGAGLPAREVFISYDTVDRTYPAGMSNGLGHATQVAYHGGLGVMAVSVDENGLTTRWRYDGFGRVRVVDVPGASDSTLSYTGCASGAPCALTVRNQQRTSTAADGVKEVLTTLDRLGRPLSVGSLTFGGEPVRATTEYDALGRLARQWLPSPTGGPPLATTFAYDVLGRPVMTTYSDGTRRSWQYDDGGRVTSWDEKGNVTVTVLDAYGRPGTTEDVLDSQRVVTRYRYGPFGVLESVTNGYGQGPRYQYDRLGRLTRQEDPDSGVRVTRYNPFGEPVEETDGNGDTTVYTRDTLGRVLTATNRDGVSRFTWDQPDPNNSSLGRVGRLLSSVQEADPSTSLDDIAVVHTYDALGRPVEEAWNVEGVPYSLSWTYDDYGLLRQLAYPGVGTARFAVEYGYKPWGALESVREASGSTVYWQAQARNGLDQLTSEVFGNGVVSQRRYDKRGRLLFIDTKAGAQPLQALAYEYEANSNLRSRHDRVGRTTEDFSYDALDRLKTWTAYQNCGRTVVDYSYDTLGNLLGRSVREGTGQSLSYFYEGTGGAGLHAVSRSSLGAYTYDASGNQVTAPGRTVEYTTFNLPSRVTQAGQSTTFRYDMMNRRTVKRAPNGDVTVSLGGLYEVRRTADGRAVHGFNVLGAEQPVARVAWAADAAGTVTARKVLYLHTDQLGSLETVTDEAGGVVERMRYEPFGGRRFAHALESQRARANPWVRQGFTGHEHDEELGLINMKGRMYDPALGRFLSPDPLMVGPRPSQALNRYSYGLNNPLRYTDPTGFANFELPVIVYDSWFGGSVVAGSSYRIITQVVETRYFARGEYIDHQVIVMEDPFTYFLRRIFLSNWSFTNVVDFGKGALLGGLAGAVPLLGLVPPPEGKSEAFYQGHAGALFAWGGVQLIGAAVGGLAGTGAAVGGSAAALTGVGAIVGAPAAALGVSVAFASAVAATAGVANMVGAYNAVQMANQAGKSGGSSSTSGNGDAPRASPPSSVSLKPERGYLGSKKHGIHWTEGAATAKSTGTPQGQWGSVADLEFAGQKAATLNPGQGRHFDLPAGHSSTVWRVDGTQVPASRIWVRNNGTGTFHGYPLE